MEYKFKKNVDLGNIEAENDELLLESFVEKSEYKLVKDVNNHNCILLGRTGSGKSAIIRIIEEREHNVKRIEPENLSLRHLSNSNIITYFKELNVKLDLFYKVLWKHVFIVELIKLHYGDNIEKTKSMLTWIKEKFNHDERKKRAIDYLEKWEDEFWLTTEHRIKEIETNLEKRFTNELNGELTFNDLITGNSKTKLDLTNSKNITTELIHKAQKVVNESQVDEIIEIQKILVEIFSKNQKKYFITIDDLDKDWVDSQIVYDLIKGLIEVIKDFRKIPNTKIIIALRTNILHKIFYKNLSRGIQREKYEYLYLKLEWDRQELTELINKRLGILMRGTYTKEVPKAEDILPRQTQRFSSGLDYILERTLMRPRDVLSYFNMIIRKSNGKSQIPRDTIKKCEREYSNSRLQALNDEWLENYGSLYVLYSFLKRGKVSFTQESIKEKCEEYFFTQVANGETQSLSKELIEYFDAYIETEKIEPLLEKVLLILYEVGIIGIKIGAEESLDFANNYINYNSEDFNESTRFYLHPMIYKAFSVSRKNMKHKLENGES